MKIVENSSEQIVQMITLLFKYFGAFEKYFNVIHIFLFTTGVNLENCFSEAQSNWQLNQPAESVTDPNEGTKFCENTN